ncbi:MAG: hypothetical protein K2X29_02535, partial [Candidatus Obscuribacterales bacterium]|nr:hypothetical protein [Candidatus Obscuribacterales bacterium]
TYGIDKNITMSSIIWSTYANDNATIFNFNRAFQLESCLLWEFYIFAKQSMFAWKKAAFSFQLEL